MGYSSAVVSVLALVGFVGASVGDNALDSGERVVLVAPVLAPPKDSRTHATDRARQFPILILLAQQNPSPGVREPEPKSLGRNIQPIYVQKLEDQDRPEPSRLNRQKRHVHKFKSWGGGGGYGGGYRGGYGGDYWGGGGGGYPSGGHGGGYQEPSKTIVIHVSKGYGGYGGHQGGYDHGYQQGGGGSQHVVYQPVAVPVGNYGGGGCGGGCGGGGGGGGFSTATATATASAQSSSYG